MMNGLSIMNGDDNQKKGVNHNGRKEDDSNFETVSQGCAGSCFYVEQKEGDIGQGVYQKSRFYFGEISCNDKSCRKRIKKD